jgi:MoaA/NifB/PqqE/SkfB family radical SAM enzyme
MTLSVLYRGPLSSCNYACGYCPFAKRTETADELAHDRACLERFVQWVGSRPHPVGVLFTPWGEALVRRWYQDALAELTNTPHVVKAAVQTNLSCKLDWVDGCDLGRLALWCTFHPGETTRQKFMAKCRTLTEKGVRFSVGVVGLKDHLAEIAALRAELPAAVYLWVNAYKREADYYPSDMIADLTAVDPLFPLNNTRHPSLGQPCHTGHTVVSVAGDGTARRCHFVDTPLGNIYDADFETCLTPRPCPNATCGCHIGYVHLQPLGLYNRFAGGVLERIPGDHP